MVDRQMLRIVLMVSPAIVALAYAVVELDVAVGWVYLGILVIGCLAGALDMRAFDRKHAPGRDSRPQG